MRALMKIGLVAISCACSWIASVQPGVAQDMVRGYALIETEPGNHIPDSLGSLMNCKALTHPLLGSDVIASIECNDLESLNQAMGEIPKIAGVQQVTLWSVKKE